MLVELTVKGFLDKTAGSDPVPGGGSISALNAALASALAEMVGNLTIGRPKYAEYEEEMKGIVEKMKGYQRAFVKDIDADADAYNIVFNSFKLPKETDQEKTLRSAKIQEATIHAANVPLGIATKAYEMMGLIERVAKIGNQNAITDACVAMMAARTAVLGAILNVKINLGSIKDQEYVASTSKMVAELEKNAIEREHKLLEEIKKTL